MFARMNAMRDFVRAHAAPALRPHGFRKAGSHLALALPDDDLLILEFNVHRVDPVRDVFDMTFKYALRTYWRWITLNEPNPRRMDSASSVAWCYVMPPADFAWAPDRPKPFCTRWAADLPAESEALGEAFREAVDTEILPLVQRMASRERLLAAFDAAASRSCASARSTATCCSVSTRVTLPRSSPCSLNLPTTGNNLGSRRGLGPTWLQPRSDFLPRGPGEAESRSGGR